MIEDDVYRIPSSSRNSSVVHLLRPQQQPQQNLAKSDKIRSHISSDSSTTVSSINNSENFSDFTLFERRHEYSKTEIECLYDGVRECGLHFRTIWLKYRKKFHPSRNPVKLYDKWRHQLKYHTKEEYIKINKLGDILHKFLTVMPSKNHTYELFFSFFPERTFNHYIWTFDVI